jgi:hypothetical protein
MLRVPPDRARLSYTKTIAGKHLPMQSRRNSPSFWMSDTTLAGTLSVSLVAIAPGTCDLASEQFVAKIVVLDAQH